VARGRKSVWLAEAGWSREWSGCEEISAQGEELCLGARRKRADRAATRVEFSVFWKLVSWGTGDEGGRRTEQDLSGCEGLYDDHACATVGTDPGTGRVGDGEVVLIFRFRCTAQQLPAKRQQMGSSPVSEEAEVADANEAWRQQVQEKSSQELLERERHRSLFVLVSGVAPTKGDLLVGKGDEPMVGDGDAMGVAA